MVILLKWQVDSGWQHDLLSGTEKRGLGEINEMFRVIQALAGNLREREQHEQDGHVEVTLECDSER